MIKMQNPQSKSAMEQGDKNDLNVVFYLKLGASRFSLSKHFEYGANQVVLFGEQQMNYLYQHCEFMLFVGNDVRLTSWLYAL